MSGKGAHEADEFILRPQPMRINVTGTGALTCLASGAQSYEWYEDGHLIEGETGDSLTLNWEKTKAKTDKHTYTYSVRPVYTVFNERVLGEEATALVEFVPFGTRIVVR